jgi:hypothetical protein
MWSSSLILIKLNGEASAHYLEVTGTVPASPVPASPVAKSAMVGMDREETVSRRVSTGINREYIGLTSAFTYISDAISGTKHHLGSFGDV